MPEIKRLIGVVPDFQNLYDRLSVRHNLEFFADLNKIDRKRVDTVLEEVFLAEHQHKACKDLSRGLRQRALIARGLLHTPSLFFLDEPTSALDPHSAKLIRDLVLKLKANGTTVFLTTHYMEEADTLCDRIAIMNQGSIVTCGQPAQLKKQFGKKSAVVEFIQNNAHHEQEFSIEDESDKSQLARLLNEATIIKLHTQEARLEEVFLKVTGDTWKSENEEAL
jgi:ABC-2 type transport system ATP-binding protein